MENGDVEIPEEDVLDPEDFEYFQDMRNSAFIQGIAIGFLSEIQHTVIKLCKTQTEHLDLRLGTWATFKLRGCLKSIPVDQQWRIQLREYYCQSRVQITLYKETKIVPKDTEEVNSYQSEPETVQQTTISPTPPPMISMVELFNQRQEKLEKRRLRIAGLSNRILENPQEHIPELQELCRLCDEKDVDVEITTRKLAMVSLLTVFKDIIPGQVQYYTEEVNSYQSEPETVQQTTISPTPPPMISMVELFNQRQEKLEKRRLRIAGLSNRILENPQEHIPELQELCRLCDEKDVDVEITTRKLAMVSLLTVFKDIIPGQHNAIFFQGLIMVAVQCMCDLLTSLPHFNFHTNLVAVLVPRMNDKCLDGQISKQCFDAFVKLFKQDSLGKVSLEAVKFISKFVKRKQFRVQPCVLETFLHLRINPLVIQALKKSNEKKSVVELKLEKKKHRIEKKLKGKMSKKEKKHGQSNCPAFFQQQTEILKFVFVTYFRVLKTIGHCPLLSPVLEGLAKFAHLINVEFFNDLMAAIQSLLNNENLTLRETLNCALTAIKILSGQGEALNIDPRGFYNMLYSCLLQVDAGSNSQDAFIVLQCLEEMLKKRRKQVPSQRVSGFVKRLCTVSLHSQANGALAFLSYVKSFLQSHTKVHALLDNESIGIGLFRPDVNDPELSNADSSTAWELALLRTAHYHPLVKMIAHHVAQGAPSKGHFSAIMRKSPEALWQEYDSSEMKLNPDMDKNTPMNNKKVLFKKVRHISAGGWKIADMESDAINALDFTERRGSSAKFTLALRQAAR
ncbi:PREDICTED: nucleolar complex protein 3 homolog [Acropora digitifera]|uniref:nucleolar complex protein 3 homolog n=1 Tax=Acropora digitifera TaxID=70779 RepID=UPI00077A5A95|nr:PREDICTED: nucleolar complex protein 3 homolog [Acropora digitifera]